MSRARPEDSAAEKFVSPAYAAVRMCLPRLNPVSANSAPPPATAAEFRMDVPSRRLIRPIARMSPARAAQRSVSPSPAGLGRHASEIEMSPGRTVTVRFSDEAT